MAEDSGAVDLLGMPLRPLPDKRGRRKLRWHAETYEKVEVLAAGGLSQEEIADAIGVSVPTLTKYFRHELDKALSRQKAEQLDLLAKAARKGNVAAIKAYGDELDKQRAALAMRGRERQPAPRANAVRRGKKEQRQAAAASVAQSGGKYAPPPAPRLVIDNR